MDLQIDDNGDMLNDYRNLKELLIKANDLYYNKNKPIMSDEEYDSYYKHLEHLEDVLGIQDPDSPTNAVGHATESHSKVKHDYRMYSIANTYRGEELEEFLSDINDTFNRDVEFVAEPKLDGASLSIVYKNGKLFQAITRGNGIIGADVTHVANVISNIPKSIAYKDDLTLRGEVIIGYKDAKKFMLGDTDSHPRNIASGTLSLKNSNIDKIKERPIKFICYYVANEIKGIEPTQTAYGEFIKSLGFDVTPKYIFNSENYENVINIIREMYNKNSGEYGDTPIDGVVIKVNDLYLQKELGYTNKYPKWATAFKFPSIVERTELMDIFTTVGKSGAITPVARINPVTINGSVITYVTLHNFKNIIDKDIRIGDIVEVTKGGEIIPYIIRSIHDENHFKLDKFKTPDTCIGCGSETEYRPRNSTLYCSNKHKCPAIKFMRISHYISREAANIMGLGDKILEALINAGYIKDIEDIYKLKYNEADILKNVNISPLILKKIIKSVDNSIRNAGPENILNGLCIDGVGIAMANKILKKFYLYDLPNVTAKELSTIDGLGPIIIENIIGFFKDNDILSRLHKYGIGLNTTVDMIPNDFLKDKKFSITGIFNKYNRNELITNLTRRGAIFNNSPNKHTNFILVGDQAGSKLKKAEDLGIKIYREKDIEYLFEQDN